MSRGCAVQSSRFRGGACSCGLRMAPSGAGSGMARVVGRDGDAAAEAVGGGGGLWDGGCAPGRRLGGLSHAVQFRGLYVYVRIRVSVYAYTCPCARANAVSGPFFREGRPPSQILSLHVHNTLTASTMSRPRLLVVHSVCRLYSGQRVCVQCLQTLCTVSTD